MLPRRFAAFGGCVEPAGTDASSVRVCLSGDAASSGWLSLEKSDRKVRFERGRTDRCVAASMREHGCAPCEMPHGRRRVAGTG
jgi:hypothetical protein